MYDDEGNEQLFQVLASHESDGTLYLLAITGLPADEEDDSDDDEDAEVLHFKCISTNGGAQDEDDMVFEIVDEEHEDFNKVLELFKADYEALEIIIEE